MQSVTKASGAAASPSGWSAIRVAASRNSTALRNRPRRISGVQGFVRTMSAGPFAQMATEPSSLARDGKAVLLHVTENWIIPRRKQFPYGVLKRSQVVARPYDNVGCQGAYLRIPDIKRCIVGADQQNVYVTLLGHRAASR